jgi:serine/threonine protein kinase/WD40 repeat protein
MNESRIQLIERLFHEALQLKPAERSAFLKAQCADDPELRNAVERLLEHDREPDDTGGFLNSPIVRTETKSDLPGATGKENIAGGPEFPGEDAIPGYQLLNQLGHGGMGVVYKARDLELNRTVAIKMLLISGETEEVLPRFRAEAETLARLQHPNVVQIYEVGVSAGRAYFAMEYVPGPSLAERLDGLPQPIASAVRLIEVVARAIHAVHKQGIIHRDLKPANILFAGDPSRRSQEVARQSRLEAVDWLVPKITDFGVAKDITSSRDLTQTGQTMGTPSYMAPEQAQGKSDKIGSGTDIYALGTILYELLTGRPPFVAATAPEIFTQLLTEDPLPPSRLVPKLPRDLETISLKCLAKDPHRRYRTTLELADDLHAFQTGKTIRARPTGWLERAWRWCRRQPLAAASLTAVGLLIVALVSTVLFYDARLREALAQTKNTAEDERQEIIKLEIQIGTRELDEGDAFRALLWFSDALDHERGDAQAELPHRQRIAAALQQFPDLLELNSFDQPVIQSRMAQAASWEVTTAPDGTLQIWNLGTGQRICPDLKHDSEVKIAEFDQEGRLLATATRGGVVHLWEVASGRASRPPVRLAQPVQRLLFATGKKGLLIQGIDNSVHLWDTNDGKLTAIPGIAPKASRYCLISGDGSTVFTVDDSGKARLVKVATGTSIELPFSLSQGVTKATFSANGGRLGVADTQNAVWVWDVASAKSLGESLRQTCPVSHLSFDPRGDRLLAGCDDGAVHIWEIGKARRPVALPRHDWAIDHAHFSFDGLCVLTAARGRLRVWDATTGQPLTPYLVHDHPIGHAYFGPDSRQLLVVEAPGDVRKWRLSPIPSDKKRFANRPASELARLAQVFSGQRIELDGAMTALSHDDLRAVWKNMRPAVTSSAPDN